MLTCAPTFCPAETEGRRICSNSLPQNRLANLAARQLERRDGHHLDHFRHVGEVQGADTVRRRVVVRVEVLVRERIRDQHGHPLVVLEAGVVAAVLDRTVVRIDRAEVQSVLLGGASENLDQLVGTVLVHVVVNVDTVILTLAVADHVHLDHADLLEVLLLDRIRVGVAAVQPLLFTGEVHEADGEVVVHLREQFRQLHDADRAGSVIVGARGDLLGTPRVAGGRVEVRATNEALARVHLTGELDHQVVELGAANLVLVTERLQTQTSVVRLQILVGELELAGMAVAADDLLGLAGEREGLLTSDIAQLRLDFADRNRRNQSRDLGVGRREIRVVDRVDDVRSATLFRLVVLADVDAGPFVLVMLVPIGAVHRTEGRRLIEVLPDPPTDDGGDRNSKNQGIEPIDAKNVHGKSPCCVR